MRHRVKKTKLNRDRDGRIALERGLIKQIIAYGSVETTLMKAKYIRPKVEKLVTKAKKNDLATRRLLIQRIDDKKLVDKLLKDIAPKYKKVNGGYLRIRRTEVRKGDAAQMAEISFVEVVQPKVDTQKTNKNPTKKDVVDKKTTKKENTTSKKEKVEKKGK